jgi:carbon-monoxide dehydrogenase medium subunit
VSPGPDLYEPTSVEAAIDALASTGPDAKLVAGATAVTIMLRSRLITPRALVSLARVPGLREIREERGHIVLGALVTHREVELSPLVRRLVPVLAETFGTVANVRVRNAATVGGVVAEADYASDPPTAFVALDALIQARGPKGAREIRAGDFFRGFYQTALEADEIVTAVRVPLPAPGLHGAYEKFVTRSSEDRPCLGVLALVRMQGANCTDLRVALGAVTETPRRYADLEARGVGTALGADIVGEIAAGYAARTDPIDDLRGSAWYRKMVIEVWVRRAILRAAAAAVRA